MALSIVSAHTDFELCAVAELFSPSVSHACSFAEEQEAIGVALDDGCFDSYLDASTRPLIQHPGKAPVVPYLLLEDEEPLSPSHSSHFPSNHVSTHSEPWSEDKHLRSRTHSYSSFPTFHLPRRPRTRTQSSAGVSTSDSDTPSLSSSTTSFSSSRSQFYSSSPPISPATLKTPVDHAPISLTIIEERPTEDQEANGRRLSQSSGGIIFAPMGDSSPLEKFLLPLKAPETRPRNRNIEHLRVQVPPPSIRFPIISPSPDSTIDFTSPMGTTYTPVDGPRPSGKLSLNRIISPTSKISSYAESKMGWQSSSPTPSIVVSKLSRKEEAKEEKLRKAEAKRMKKAEQKAKVERLAEELKERERRKLLALDKQSVHSNRSGVRGGGGRRQWDSDIAMYNGLGAAI
ncbi:hypothetical protein PAXRUDRAFT_495840 [Paxillus rubicundulus Ve08.2h10]|uniref:Uncharacterized protein n=1 Tax=Paxillus rubicundulus Ve08.2h10 TaxID=930991 RepID=A0A0D0D9J0_9AGAM|nr:hypothetical protein PAXRUDRAFT_495840 [Paxillus rubicundulus Ve08.2h10]